MLHEPCGSAQFPEPAVCLIAVPGSHVETVSVSKVAVALFGPAETGDHDGSVYEVPFARTERNLLEVDEHRLAIAEQDISYFRLAVDRTDR